MQHSSPQPIVNTMVTERKVLTRFVRAVGNISNMVTALTPCAASTKLGCSILKVDVLYGEWQPLEGGVGQFDESLKLFAEAEPLLGGNIDFAVDHARTIGFAGAKAKNGALLKDAITRHAAIHAKSPQHTMNLQNWAITLFYMGNYAGAWEKIKLAEATPRHAELDPHFISALQSRMPRP